MSYFATAYTIHFDDTMAYGSHHFLTTFKFQCAARESFLFGPHVFDVAGVREALQQVHLLTVDAYTRNLHPAQLGERVAILLTFEEYGRGSLRFCYRVVGEKGQGICAGFQTIVCADPQTHAPMAMPSPLAHALSQLQELQERPAQDSFRTRVLAGGQFTQSLFEEAELSTAQQFLAQRYPSPQIVPPPKVTTQRTATSTEAIALPAVAIGPATEAWVFAGQAAFSPHLLADRMERYRSMDASTQQELEAAAELMVELSGTAARQLFSTDSTDIASAVRADPWLSQFAIHLQNVLGAKFRQASGQTPSYLLGQSFGELAALQIAGCFDLLTGLRCVALRARALQQCAPRDGGLLLAACSRSLAAAEAQLHGAQHVVIAGRNHDQQTLLSGPQIELEQLRKRFQQLAITCTPLAGSTAYHHPQLRQAAEQWLCELRQLRFSPPARQVFTAVGRRLISADDDLPLVMVGQLLRPFDLQGALEELVDREVTRFVDCGSRGGLQRLIAHAVSPEAEVVLATDIPPESVTAKPTTYISPAKGSLAPSDQTPPAQGLENSSAAAHSVISQEQRPQIAIVGRGCLLPGGAHGPEQLFAAIAQQRSGIVDMRHIDPHWSEDFYAEQLQPDRSYSPLFGRVQDTDLVAPSGIDEQVFRSFSRSQQLFCVALAPCLAGLKGALRIGCLVGATADGFEDLDEVAALRWAGIDPHDELVDAALDVKRRARLTPQSALQQVVDYMLQPGIEVTLIDAACASSLYAVALGMHALEAGQLDAVIAGGVFCPGPGNSCLFSQFRGTTTTGCRPFDAQADGVVFSEGAALITLRRLHDAQRLQLDIDALVLGAGLSSDGKSSSANVPQSRGQIISLERCYADYGIDPGTIQGIEAHGTSTPVGDATELETLHQFFGGRVQSPLLIHSLKGLLGHAGWAAGTASIVAAIEFMRHGSFPAQAHFRAPSSALTNAAKTLAVPAIPQPLLQGPCRLAIDGFGFGGANAHVVLERYPTPPQSGHQPDQFTPGQVRLPAVSIAEEVVVVATHVEPAMLQQRFDRAAIHLPPKQIILPQLAEDLDLSQILAARLVDALAAKLQFEQPAARRETSLVLAMSGKTARGVEATLRILTPRWRRLLAGQNATLLRLKRAYEQSRPAGPYTLQCMMPNVAAGRAALLSNLNGPNFVVDAGPNSLRAALTAAQGLLTGGAAPQMVMVAAIQIDFPGCVSCSDTNESEELACGFALTTRKTAVDRGLPIISTLESALKVAELSASDARPQASMVTQARRLIKALGGTVDERALEPSLPDNNTESSSGAISAAVLHTPLWIEKPLRSKAVIEDVMPGRQLYLLSANSPQLPACIETLTSQCAGSLVLIVGDQAEALAASVQHPQVLGLQWNEDGHFANVAVAERIRCSAPTALVAVDFVCEWDRLASLERLAVDTALCEAAFLLTQLLAEQLRLGTMQLWGLCLEGWRGQVHPQSGPMAGLIKSLAREFPQTRVGHLCTRGLSLSAALSALSSEQSQTDDDESELVYDQQQRLVRRLRPVTAAVREQPIVQLDQRSVVVATGGVRGVTAVLVESILKETQCTVVVLGRSVPEAGPENFADGRLEQEFYSTSLQRYPHATLGELKQEFTRQRIRWETHQAIQGLSTVGGRLVYLTCDVMDQQQVAKAIDHIASQWGRIDWLLHGAGVQLSKRLQDRRLAEWRLTYATKINGLHHLLSACRDRLGSVVPVHALTSAFSIFGNDGQHDYGAANESLDRLCDLPPATPQLAWSSLAWLAWDGIGMTRGSEYRALAQRRRLLAVTPAIGEQLFGDVLAGRTRSAINVPMSTAEHVEYRVKTIPPSTAGRSGRCRELQLDLRSMSWLEDHKVRNTPTLPGAWILDWMIEVARQITPDSVQGGSVEVSDLAFNRFVRLIGQQSPNVRVVAEWSGSHVDTWLLADVIHPRGSLLQKDVRCASARLRFTAVQEDGWEKSLGMFTPSAARNRVRDPYCGAGETVALSHGFDCLRDIEIEPHGRRAKFSPSYGQGASRNIPALLLDAAWRVGAMYAASEGESAFVPVRIRRMVLPLQASVETPERAACQILSTAPSVENHYARWKRTEVLDANGSLRLLVEDALAAQVT